MYCLLELLAVVCLVVFLSTILFVVGATVILVDEGLRSVLRLPAQYVRQVVSFSTSMTMGWKMSIPDQRGSLISKAGKL